ncbi:hypothetical protein [Actinoplanes palleronii]|uniref:HK97 gp10 family phage protein n=1 Tax=Actinoplanes palleronii TaxID=113570 RepID=A0ABQ4B416_9ACTN|nr:hypothetical protein [Actinoplanes palleronii]GIE65407.1 hypothetical protein Apa02nite_015150 [Actinoplanes palleronii]
MITFGVDGQSLKTVAAHLAAQENGKLLKRELGAKIRKALQPAVAEARAGILAMDSGGLPLDGGGLRAAIARRVRAQAKLSGRFPGAKVHVSKRGMPRGFELAARRTNRRKGWRHPVFGNTDVWARQLGRPGWFDDPMRRGRPRYRRAVLEAMETVARQITRRV